MTLQLRGFLPFTTVQVEYRGVRLEIPDVLVDTGSATSVLSIDVVAELQIRPELVIFSTGSTESEVLSTSSAATSTG